MTGARELDRTEWGTIVYVCEEGHKGVEKKRGEKESDRRQKRTREEKGGEWKKRRQSNRGVKEKWLKGLRDGERGEKRERKVSRRRKNGRDSESSWIAGERERGGMSPMAATHHSQLNDAIFFPLFPLLFHGKGVEGEGVRPAPNQTGSYRVHMVQVGLSSTRGTVWMTSEIRNGAGGL